MTKFINVSQIRSLEFGVTTLCNAGCPLCSRHVSGTSTVVDNLKLQSIPVEDFISITDSLKDHYHNIEASFSGVWGDPMMHPQIFEILNYASNRYKTVDIDTNGGMQSTDFWHSLGLLSKKTGLKVTFSIDGLEDTNVLYRINTDYNKIIHNARTFINAGGKAKWKFIVFKHNEHQIDQAKQLATEMGFWKFKTHHSKRFELPNIQQQIAGNAYKAKINKVDTVKKQQGHTLQPSKKVLQSEDRVLSVQKQNKEQSQQIDCRSVDQGYLYVSHDSTLWPCCWFESLRINSSLWQKYWDTITSKYTENFNCLKTNTIEQLLEHDYFKTHLPKSWTDESYSKCHQCNVMCGKSQYRKHIETKEEL